MMSILKCLMTLEKVDQTFSNRRNKNFVIWLEKTKTIKQPDQANIKNVASILSYNLKFKTIKRRNCFRIENSLVLILLERKK